MSQNTDPFPTPRGALSPEGVSARVMQHQFVGRLDRRCEVCNRPDRDPIHAVPLGVPGYAGAKGAVPEPQGPTSLPSTSAGRRLWEHWTDLTDSPTVDLWWRQTIVQIEAEARADHEETLRQRGWVDSYEFETATAMSHGEGLAEARAAAPPDIDVERRAVVAAARIFLAAHDRVIAADPVARDDTFAMKNAADTLRQVLAFYDASDATRPLRINPYDFLEDDERERLRVNLVEIDRLRRRARAKASQITLGASPDATRREPE